MSIQDYREERDVKAREYRKILDLNKGKLTEDEVKKLDALESDISGLESRIEREEKAMAMAAEKIAMDAIDQIEKGKKSDETRTPKAMLNKWARGGDNALNAEDWAYIRNTMSTTTSSEGGYTVETEVASSVMEALKAYGGMRAACFVLNTAQGNPMNWPTSDGTSEEGELVAENTAATDADIAFGVKSLPVYKYSSKVVTVPIELLQDTTIDMESFVNQRIVTRLGRITNGHFTTGTGSGQPNGIVPSVTVGKTGAAGQVATIIYDDLVDIEHSIDPAYRLSQKCGFMFNDAVLKVLKKLKDTQNRPLWLPEIGGSAPAQILGYKYTINQHMAVPAASAKSLLFGDFDKYVIRDVMAITYHRFTDSAYAKKGQVGFLAFMRSGGNYMDVGGAVKCFQNPAT